MPNNLPRDCAASPDAKTSNVPGPFLSTPENSEQFHRLQNLFDKSFKAARIGIWECTLPDETITWTDTVYELFDLEPRSPLTRDATVALYSPESRKKLTEARSAAIRDGDGFSLDAEIITARGNHRWIRITAIVERESGVPVRLFGMKQDITSEKLMFEHTRRLAETDAVTGLASRARFETVFDEAVRGGLSARTALLLIDLDSFKAVNDRFGHQAGDDCLRDAGRRLAEAVPEAKLVARLGGDEFAVIHDCGSMKQLEEICKTIIGKLEWWIGPAPGKLKVSASIGATIILPGMAAKDIFAEADKALYAVKASGKNSFGFLPAAGPVADVA